MGGIYVHEIGDEGSAKDSTVQLGDQLVSVGGASAVGKTFDDAMAMMVALDGPMELEFGA